MSLLVLAPQVAPSAGVLPAGQHGLVYNYGYAQEDEDSPRAGCCCGFPLFDSTARKARANTIAELHRQHQLAQYQQATAIQQYQQQGVTSHANAVVEGSNRCGLVNW
jgi:hypothetical protein